MSQPSRDGSEQESSSVNLLTGGSLTETTASSSQESREIESTEEKIVDPASLNKSCQKMFKNISEYLQCELSASLDDYELLQKLNELTKQKYIEMDDVTKGLTTRMEQINKKYEELKPYLEMIDKVDASVTNLEEAAHKLDAYSKELETRFKKLEKAAS